MLFTISFYFTIYDNYTSKTCDSLCIMFEIVKRMCPHSSTLQIETEGGSLGNATDKWETDKTFIFIKFIQQMKV